MTSSGWQGFVIQSSAPRRSPRTRWATVDGPVQTTTPSSGSAAHSRSSHAQACGPSTARSMTRALSRIETTASVETGLASTRCSQPRRSRRLLSTWMKPLSRSSTAIRRAAPAAGAPSDAGDGPPRSSAPTLAVIGAQCRGWEGCLSVLGSNVTRCSQPGTRYLRRSGLRPGAVLGGAGRRVRCGIGASPSGVGGIRELPEQARHDERDLLADVHGVVADPLERPRDEGHVHRPLARVLVVADLDREAKDLAVQAVDLAILADEVFGEADVAGGEGGPPLHDLRARMRAHPRQFLQNLLVHGRLVPRERDQLGDVHALVAHSLYVLDHVQQR